MMTKNISQLLALTFVLGLGQGCGKDKDTTKPGETATQKKKEKEEKAQAEAEEDFAKAVATYDKAMADGSISGDECGKAAGAFKKVSDAHGDRMQIAKFNAAAIYELCGDKGKAKKMYEELAKKKFHLALNNLGVMYWNEGKPLVDHVTLQFLPDEATALAEAEAEQADSPEAAADDVVDAEFEEVDEDKKAS